jgi:predicted DNA-binding transcriptional regulator AlpA
MRHQETPEYPALDRPTRILRTPGAADYVGLSTSTLEKKRLAGGGPAFIRLGGRAVGYDVRDLDAWLEKQRQSDPINSSTKSQD